MANQRQWINSFPKIDLILPQLKHDRTTFSRVYLAFKIIWYANMHAIHTSERVDDKSHHSQINLVGAFCLIILCRYCRSRNIGTIRNSNTMREGKKTVNKRNHWVPSLGNVFWLIIYFCHFSCHFKRSKHRFCKRLFNGMRSHVIVCVNCTLI